MKKLFILILLFAISLAQIHAQIIANGDFETGTFSGGNCLTNPNFDQTTNTAPFQSGASCIPQNTTVWLASHGTPEIYENFVHNNFGVMWSGDFNNDGHTYGEGLWMYCLFEAGKQYTLSLKMFTGSMTLNHVYIDLTDQLTALNTISYVPSSGAYNIPVVTNRQELLHYTNFYSANLTNVNITFTPNQNYHGLWIHPVSNTYPIGILYIDDVSFSDCLDYEDYQNTSSLPALTSRSNYIKASNNTNVLNAQSATFTAGEYIELNPTFQAASGSVFHAYIGGCSQLLCAYAENRIITAGVDAEESEASFSVYPNPTNGILMFQQAVTNKQEVFVYDAYGKLILQQTVIGKAILNLEGYPKGMYLIKSVSSSGRSETKKIILE
jgi:hypothetical protein